MAKHIGKVSQSYFAWAVALLYKEVVSIHQLENIPISNALGIRK